MQTKSADQGQAARAVGQSDGRILILHIGDHKTGTTSIQNAFARKQILIDGETPFYGSRLAHNFLPHAINTIAAKPNDPHGQDASKRVSDLVEAFATAQNRFNVISAEEFELFDPNELRRWLMRNFPDTFETIRIVAYVRPHLQRVVSEFAERTKIGWFDGDLEAFFSLCRKQSLYHYAPRFETWRKAFGADFVLRPFERSALADNSLLTDFVTAALGHVKVTANPFREANESLSLEDLLRVKYLHSKAPSRGKPFQHDFGWTLHRLISKLPRPEAATKVRLHRDLAERASQYYRFDARQLDQAFFSDAPCMEAALEADLKSACDTAQPARAEEIFSDSEMRSLELAAQTINVMLENNKAPWFRYFHKKRLEDLHKDSD